MFELPAFLDSAETLLIQDPRDPATTWTVAADGSYTAWAVRRPSSRLTVVAA